jgi:polysaccharide biosynthesis protein PslG
VWRRARGPLAGAAALAACLAALAALSGGAEEHSGRGSGPGPTFLGVVAEDAFGKPGAYRRDNLARLHRAGAGLVRQTFDWSYIEPAPGRYDLSLYDSYVAALAARHLRLLPILFDPPPFRSSAPANPRHGTYPPSRPADMGEFAAMLARRYGPGGSFWDEHARLPRLPVRSWQIWNEPNLPVYWLPRPNAREYVAMLRAAHGAIKAVDRRAEVVTAGIPASLLSGAIRFKTFIRGMYKAKGARYFETLAPNAYGKTAQDVIRNMGDLRRLMNGSGDRRGKIWVTEVGWGTGGPRHRFNIGERGQAAQIPKLLRGLHRARGRLRMRGVVYFGWQDLPPYGPAFKDMWGLHTGLFKRNGRAKPAYGAFKRVAPRLR